MDTKCDVPSRWAQITHSAWTNARNVDHTDDNFDCSTSFVRLVFRYFTFDSSNLSSPPDRYEPKKDSLSKSVELEITNTSLHSMNLNPLSSSHIYVVWPPDPSIIATMGPSLRIDLALRISRLQITIDRRAKAAIISHIAH